MLSIFVGLYKFYCWIVGMDLIFVDTPVCGMDNLVSPGLESTSPELSSSVAASLYQTESNTFDEAFEDVKKMARKQGFAVHLSTTRSNKLGIRLGKKFGAPVLVTPPQPKAKTFERCQHSEPIVNGMSTFT